MGKQWTRATLIDLYETGDALSARSKKALGLLIPVEVYVRDPQAQAQNKALGLNEIDVPYEPDLMPGPTSARIAVVDYDGDRNWLEEPAQWDAKHRCFVFKFKDTMEPITREHCDEPQFHQVNVWAVIQSALEIYQGAMIMGRSVPWAFEGNRLIVVPHAGYLDNAFYDRHSKSIQFYYCGPKDGRVYTCLSHDIIAHETGHAILDGLRPLYHEDSSLQTTAFHEFMADLAAIMTSLLNSKLLAEVAKQCEGDLSRDTVVSFLAGEFSRYALGRVFLRSPQTEKTIEKVEGSRSAYDWSEVLTGAMWDVLKAMAARCVVQDDVSMRRQPAGLQALLDAVNRFRCTALPSLDYLPPVDVQFADYARAVLRASEVADPVDKDGYRPLIRQVFDQRGIDHAEEEEQPRLAVHDIDRVSRSRTDAYHFLNEARSLLCIPAEQDFAVVDLYQTDKMLPDGRRLPREVVLQYAWRESVELKGASFGPLAGEVVSLLCGGTLVFDGRGNLLSCVRKPGTGKQEARRPQLRRYCAQERSRGEQRRQELLDYIKERIGDGHVALVERGGPGEILTRVPVMASRADDGTLRLQVTPYLRHWTGK